jgi:hypothetical protein
MRLAGARAGLALASAELTVVVSVLILLAPSRSVSTMTRSFRMGIRDLDYIWPAHRLQIHPACPVWSWSAPELRGDFRDELALE